MTTEIPMRTNVQVYKQGLFGNILLLEDNFDSGTSRDAIEVRDFYGNKQGVLLSVNTDTNNPVSTLDDSSVSLRKADNNLDIKSLTVSELAEDGTKGEFTYTTSKATFVVKIERFPAPTKITR